MMKRLVSGIRGKEAKPARPPPAVLDALKSLPMCGECRSHGVLDALQGVPLASTTFSYTHKGSVRKYYLLEFASLSAAVERQAACVICRFVLGLLIPIFGPEVLERDPPQKYYLWVDYERPNPPRSHSFRLPWQSVVAETAASRSHCSFRVDFPGIGTGARIELLERQRHDGLSPMAKAQPSTYPPVVAAKMTGQIHFEHIKGFLRVCEEQHEGCRVGTGYMATFEPPRGSVSWPLRLIDTVSKCLVCSSLSERYVALSYVWGNVEQFQCTRSALPGLLDEKDGLPRHWDKLPKTITDAIELVKAIGERYLWVDTLCIVQDDPDDKAIQIAKMDQIYSTAVLTICAVRGENAQAGLPGVFPGTRPQGSYAISPTMGLVANPGNGESHVRHSEYESRGWTLQERALARRCLYVLDATVVVSCRRWYADEKDTNWLRDRDQEERKGKINLEHAMAVYSPLYALHRAIRRGDGHILETARVYNGLVELYTKRRLTYRTDIVNAFTGIASRMEGFVSGRSLCAMPSGLLSFALLWSMANPDRLNDEKPRLERNHDWPSWAWAGYVGQIAYDNSNALLDMLGYDAEYSWRIEFDVVLPDPGPAAGRTEANEEGKACSLYLASPDQATTFSGPSSPPRPLSQILHLHTQIVDTWRFRFSEYTHPDPDKEGQPWRWYFYGGRTAWRANIHDNTSVPQPKCGRESLCGMLMDGPTDLGLLERRNNARAAVYTGYSFVLLSRSVTPNQKGFGSEVSRPKSQGGDGWVNPMLELHDEALKWYPVTGKRDRRRAQILSVLVVGWRKQDGFAERVGIAFVKAEAWEQAGPVQRCVRVV
ncbi:hypothetical protein OQA88_5202 [Cercophora sp. LCS_1]